MLLYRSVSATLALFAHCLQPHHVIDCLSISPLEKQLLSPSSKGSLTETGQEKERALILSEEEGCGLPAEVEVRTFRVVSAALSLLRLQFPERVVDKDVTTGYFAAGSEVYFESITVRHAVVKGIVLSIKHNNVEGVGKRGAKYTLRLMDGSREDHVPEDRVLYSSPPLFTLEHFLPADPAVSLSPSSSSSWYHGDIAFGSTAHLLALLNYTLHRSTELRLERYSDAFSPQKTAEELLGLLVVSLLHLSLAPVDRHLLYDVVADVLDSITATEEGRKASWVQSADWEVFAHWAKTLLPLPPMETEEVSPVQEIALPKTFKKYFIFIK